MTDLNHCKAQQWEICSEVLPALDDSFVLTKDFDVLQVMHLIDQFDPEVLSVMALQHSRELMLAPIWETPFGSVGDSLSRPDDWSGITPTPRETVWE